MAKDYKAVEAKAKSLGAKTVGWYINWCWANNFPTPEAGKEFVAWLEANGYEHHGYYPACPNAKNENLRVDGVRYR